MKKTILPFVLASVLLAVPLFAQMEPPPEPGQIGLSFKGGAFATGESSLTNASTNYEHVKTNGYELGVSQAFKIGDGESLRVGIEQQSTFFDQKRGMGDAVVPLPDALKSVSFSGSYTQQIDRQWAWSARLSAGSYVADTGLLSKGWGFAASAVAICNQSPTLTWMLGLAYNSLMSDLRVLPVGGLIWRPAKQWSVAVGFPKTAVTYHFNKDLSLGLALSGAGGAYRVKDDPAPGVAPRSLADSKLEQRELRVGLETSWKINSSVRLAGTIGEVVYRKLKYVDRDFDLKSHGVAPFVGATAVVSF